MDVKKSRLGKVRGNRKGPPKGKRQPGEDA